MPNRADNCCEIAGNVGEVNATWRQRLRIVGNTSSTVGAHKSQTVAGGGYSSDFNKVEAASIRKRSTSSITITCHGERVGSSDARSIRSRAASTL